ncbi:hypothetical protein [Thermococcus sp. JCM 11816]|uniref:hypothetical protein n=1 Tax=Thermococcus sp. (strain JCM 11816 / KS-1) TaxID=1295125 RepID=UPI0034662E49
MRVLLVGAGGRENAIAEVLARDAELYVVAGHKNPRNREARKGLRPREGNRRPESPRLCLKWGGVDMAFIGPEAPP